MSLFENDHYRWRETYFVLFDARHRPSMAAAQAALQGMDNRFEITDVRSDDRGEFESLTLVSPDDFAAMDISYVSGEDVAQQVDELTAELRHADLTNEERKKLERLPRCDSRHL